MFDPSKEVYNSFVQIVRAIPNDVNMRSVVRHDCGGKMHYMIIATECLDWFAWDIRKGFRDWMEEIETTIARGEEYPRETQYSEWIRK